MIDESTHEWPKIVIHCNECITYFLHAILCLEHTISLQTNIYIVTSYSLIFLARANWRKGDLHQWITTVNIDFSSPGIHGVGVGVGVGVGRGWVGVGWVWVCGCGCGVGVWVWVCVCVWGGGELNYMQNNSRLCHNGTRPYTCWNYLMTSSNGPCPLQIRSCLTMPLMYGTLKSSGSISRPLSTKWQQLLFLKSIYCENIECFTAQYMHIIILILFYPLKQRHQK